MLTTVLGEMELRVANCPSQEIAFLNQLFLNPRDYAALGGESSADLYVEVSGLIYTAKPHDRVEAGGVGMNSIQRRNVAKSLSEPVVVSIFNGAGGALLSSASIEADFVVKKVARGTETMDGAALVQSILTRFTPQYLSVGQSFAIEFQGVNILLKVNALEALVVDKSTGGTLPERTSCSM